MVYTPQRGFAQTQYFDQQATALAGMLANASDINLVDSAFVGDVSPTEGLTAGIGVQVLPTTASNRPGLNYDIVVPPLETATDAAFAGVVVRNQFMRTNSKGEACFFFQDMANYARRQRAGCRIWVQLEAGTTRYDGEVYWIVRDTAGTGKRIGAFSAQSITGTATPTPATLTGGTINLNEAKAVTNGGFDITDAGGLRKISGLDLSVVETTSDIATIVQDALNTAAASTYNVAVTGSGITITTTATGTAATLTYAAPPTATGNPTDVSNALGLTQFSGGVLQQGTAGESNDTVLLTNARFLDTFSAGAAPCNNIALLELL